MQCFFYRIGHIEVFTIEHIELYVASKECSSYVNYVKTPIVNYLVKNSN